MSDSLHSAAQWVEAADGILITAGAGMGVDSGLPDFRGGQGLWEQYPGLAQQELNFIDIANPDMSAEEPRLAWGFYGHRLDLYRKTLPHDGFHILKKWAKEKAYGAFVFTSNVDGQFQKAGFDPRTIYECHGSIHQMQCFNDCGIVWEATEFIPEIDDEQCRLISELPACPVCRELARPNILMFGDPYWQGDVYRKQWVRYQKWLLNIENPVVIELGAGSFIPSARMESERRANGRLIRINPREAEIPDNRGISFFGGSLSTLKSLDHHVSI